MSESNRRYLLRQRPSGRVDESTFDLVTEPVPEIGAGEALIRTEYISVDPTNRGWLNDTPTYLPPVQIGEVVRAAGLGRVVASNNPAYEEGKLFQGLIGWQEWFVASDAAPLIPVAEMPGVESPSAYIGVLGMTGLTAWVGIHEIGKPKEGETVVVSAAAGAVGSVAGQLAKAYGARVVGIAGGPEKCALLTDELGFDAAVDYKADGWQKQLIDATPDGIDVDFENVGGEIMELIFGRLNLRRAGRPLRPDLRLQRGRPAAGPADPRQRPDQAGHDPGLHRPRPLQPGRRGRRRDRRPDGRRQDQGPRDGRRGLRAPTGRAQHAVRRRQHRQARGQDRVR